MKRIVQFVFLVFLSSSSLLAAQTNSPALIEWRLVEQMASSNTVPMNLPPSGDDKDSAKHEVIHVQKVVSLDASMVVAAWVAENPVFPTPDIAVEFSPEGKAKLARLTEENVGKRLAVIIDGKLHVAGRINSPITGGRLAWTGPRSSDEAKALVSKLNKAAKR